MAINFEQIPSYEEINLNSVTETRTVLEELNARQHLLKERTVKCGTIRPLYVKTKMPAQRYRCQYYCVCPSFRPRYECKHSGNIIIDRDILTPEEHIVYLARPKPDLAVRRKMPRYFLKKSIIANCTARVIQLAKPDRKQVADTLQNFNKIISRRHKRTLQKCLQDPANTVEYTSVRSALQLIAEEKRLKRVARRKERLRCQQLRRKIERKQRQQIRKIVCLLFEEMKEFLLNDDFKYEPSPLGEVILAAIRDFTDKEFSMTRNLRDYQKTLAYNLALWISQFLSNLNIEVAENALPDLKAPHNSCLLAPKQELTTFLPVQDYILLDDKKEQQFSEISPTVVEKSEPESETIKNDCSAPDVSIYYDARNVKNLTQDAGLLHSSSSEEEVYFSARSTRPNK